MRRNSINYRVVNPTYILFILALIYGLVSSIYYYLTPLIGLSFYYLIEHFDDEEYYLPNFLIFIYISYIEINRGLFLFSFVIFFFIFYQLTMKLIKESIICKWCQTVLYITLTYLGYYFFNLFLANTFGLEVPSIGWAYVVFIITDIFLAMIFL